jgi:hypothetical protein
MFADTTFIKELIMTNRSILAAFAVIVILPFYEKAGLNYLI